MPAPILKPFRTPPALKRAQRGMHVTPRPNPSASHSDPFFRDLHLRLRLASFLGPSWPPSTTPNLHLALTRTPSKKRRPTHQGSSHTTQEKEGHTGLHDTPGLDACAPAPLRTSSALGTHHRRRPPCASRRGTPRDAREPKDNFRREPAVNPNVAAGHRLRTRENPAGRT